MSEPFEPAHTCRCEKCYSYRQEIDALKAENEAMKTGRYERGVVWNELTALKSQLLQAEARADYFVEALEYIAKIPRVHPLSKAAGAFADEILSTAPKSAELVTELEKLRKVKEAAEQIPKWLNIENCRKENPEHPCVVLADALSALNEGGK